MNDGSQKLARERERERISKNKEYKNKNISTTVVDKLIRRLTVTRLSDDWQRSLTRLARTGLVDGADTELILLAFVEIRSGSGALISRNFSSLLPSGTTLFFLLNKVASNRSTAIFIRRCPLQIDVILVPVSGFRSSRRSRSI